MGQDTNVSGHKSLVLASGSQRRRELVSALTPPVGLITPPEDEEQLGECESPEKFVVRAAISKAKQGARQAPQGIVLGADTVVVLDGDVFGKPSNAAEAARLLRRLRGRTHRVVTGVAALDGESGRWVATAKSTDVTLRRYTDAEMEAYIASGEPFDKAGGYAIQDDLFHPAETLEGCYLNVVGLPLCEVVTLVAQMGGVTQLRPDWVLPESCRDCPLKQRHEASRL